MFCKSYIIKKSYYLRGTRVSAVYVLVENTEHSSLLFHLPDTLFEKVIEWPSPLGPDFLICKKMKLD